MEHPDGINEEGRLGHVPLDRNRILGAALEVLKEVGLRDLSMKKIADKLHVKTASLYYHVKDKEELMQMLSDRICRDMAWPESSVPWQEQIELWAEEFRRVLLTHRDAVELFKQTIARGVERLTQIEKLYQLLVAAGFQDAYIPWISSILKNYVLSFVSENVQLMTIANDQFTSSDNMSEHYDHFYSQLPEDKFPNMIRLAPIVTRPEWEKEFQFGLGVLINGLANKR
ncbi:TetR/AcrR family transcriptional regulator C-terminal domain-containing protein [Paenibacillus glycanilyticus]|uniref:TetR family transcriptional regulator n=1 Tax=Paenibacillus glycanilyticus TaxID=126569 RepID=A0ABQ6GK81_9BACL|nr:TetR/AcrR family transcriptional regulator C-terminal domain-containing protein [Paenibacillus glycanilyticus]GLX69768.1 TetR family transcriptional regulator [Paenibacillus glycanilyticus]